MTPDYQTDTIQLYRGDCLEVMPELARQGVKVDAVITDPPYGVTACEWDSVINLADMWQAIKAISAERVNVLLFGVQPFTTDLISSNREWFKYCLTWIKNKPNGWQHAKNKPMKRTEDIATFSPNPMGHFSLLGEKRMIYNPQGVKDIGEAVVKEVWYGNSMGARPNQVGKVYEAQENFPDDVLEFDSVFGEQALHPTQKPLALMEYLVLTYTNPGGLVLDFTMGSGTTGVACAKLGRRFIGIERDPGYFDIAVDRIRNAVGDYQPTKKEANEGKMMFDFGGNNAN